jgi:hypothetical protein
MKMKVVSCLGVQWRGGITKPIKKKRRSETMKKDLLKVARSTNLHFFFKYLAKFELGLEGKDFPLNSQIPSW